VVNTSKCIFNTNFACFMCDPLWSSIYMIGQDRELNFIFDFIRYKTK
jgi:hypothetical protein